MKLIVGLAGALLLVAAALSYRVHVNARADEKAHAERFRVMVDEIISDNTTLVIRIRIETLPGSLVKVTSDKPNRGGVGTGPAAAAEPGGLALTQLTIFADHVKWEAGATNARKFMLGAKTKSGSSTLSDVGPMPEAKSLAEVLTMRLKTGEYRYGDPLTLATFEDLTYSLVVTSPK